MKMKKSLCLALAFAAACFGSMAEAAATPEAQIDTILDLPLTNGDDLEMRLREPGDFAITDLDGNGRLELLFLQVTRDGVPEAAESAGIKERSAWEAIASVPVDRTLYGYEVSEDGQQLVPIAILYTDDEITPNLQYLDGTYRDAARGITYYAVSTLLRIGDAGFRVALQSVSLQNGSLQVQTFASKYGNYAIYQEQGTPEAVFDHAVDRNGRALTQSDVDAVLKAQYSASGSGKLPALIGWRSLQMLREAKMRPDGMKNLMLASWRGFSRQQ